jgi:hypothetical protein
MLLLRQGTVAARWPAVRQFVCKRQPLQLLISSNMFASSSSASSSSSSSRNRLHRLDTIGLSAENTFLRDMIPDQSTASIPYPSIPISADDPSEEVTIFLSKQLMPREVTAHFMYVVPEPVPSPKLVIASRSCCEMIGLDPAETESSLFATAMTGNSVLPGLDKLYVTPYGCHSFGQWFGQLGDGRAMSLGEVVATPEGNTSATAPAAAEATEPSSGDSTQAAPAADTRRYELQLKGCGRSAFSRGFDGRAVLRSSIREFLGKLRNIHILVFMQNGYVEFLCSLVSESLAALGVPTCRSLCVSGRYLSAHLWNRLIASYCNLGCRNWFASTASLVCSTSNPIAGSCLRCCCCD